MVVYWNALSARYIIHMLVNVFSNGNPGSGANQILHECSSKAELASRTENEIVRDEFDHSFFYFESASHQVYVKSKNKAGIVQLCGSGIYAIVALVLNRHKLKKITVHSPYDTLSAYVQDEKVFLCLPSRNLSHVKTIDSGELLYDSQMGIYCLEISESLETVELATIQKIARSLTDPHGFCVFQWGTPAGKLRYFVPWHGREEDYVTGSIQMVLTPWVASKYNCIEQSWQQISAPGGMLQSKLRGDRVEISGRCLL